VGAAEQIRLAEADVRQRGCRVDARCVAGLRPNRRLISHYPYRRMIKRS